jgi:hypothetical protein
MGHKGDIEAGYSTNKGILPPDMIEDVRAAYKNCEPFLSSASASLDQNDIVRQAKLESLKAIAKNIFGIDLEGEILQKQNWECMRMPSRNSEKDSPWLQAKIR